MGTEAHVNFRPRRPVLLKWPFHSATNFALGRYGPYPSHATALLIVPYGNS